MKKAVILGMAYFSCTVGAGFASGQEMLQYYAAFGGWGIIGAAIALILMPLISMIAMQYGSYFQATSHDRVFTLVTSKLMARFIDYTITFTQFCISFVMLAGAGANLNQQFETPLWFPQRGKGHQRARLHHAVHRGAAGDCLHPLLSQPA